MKRNQSSKLPLKTESKVNNKSDDNLSQQKIIKSKSGKYFYIKL